MAFPYLQNHEISDELEHYLDSLRTRFAWQMTVLFTVVFAIITASYVNIRLSTFVIYGIVFLISLVCLIIMAISRQYRVVFVVYSVTAVIASSYALIFNIASIHYVEFMWMLAGVSLAYFGYDKNLTLYLVVISLIAIAIFVYSSYNNHIQFLYPLDLIQQNSLYLELAAAFILNFYLFYLFHNVNQFAEKKLKYVNKQLRSQNSQIKQQNEEKTILVKEIHHRVKNNLQIVISLLRMQSVQIEDKRLRKFFDESIDRIMSMSLIHQKLYQNDGLAELQFSEYATELINSIIRTSSKRDSIAFQVDSEIENFNLEALVPLGLILNELATNSIKYAFEELDDGLITLDIKNGEKKKSVIFTYKDNGKWKEYKEDRKNFGLSLLEALAEQLDGAYTIVKGEDGTAFVFELNNITECK